MVGIFFVISKIFVVAIKVQRYYSRTQCMQIYRKIFVEPYFQN